MNKYFITYQLEVNTTITIANKVFNAKNLSDNSLLNFILETIKTHKAQTVVILFIIKLDE